MSDAQNVVIIGLGKTGSDFLAQMLTMRAKGVNVVGVSCKADSPGVALAATSGIKNLSIDEIVALGEQVDIIFDLSGDRQIRTDLRKTLFSSNNQHTVIAPESIVMLMYKIIARDDGPMKSSGKPGY